MRFLISLLAVLALSLSAIAQTSDVPQTAPSSTTTATKSATVKQAVAGHALTKAVTAVGHSFLHLPSFTKKSLGVITFAVESGVDVLHLGLEGLDKGASLELKHNPFHYANLACSRLDTGLEKAELYFFGSSN